MLATILLGAATMLVSMMIQVAAVVVMVRWLIGKIGSGRVRAGFLSDSLILTGVLLVLFAGHVIQIGFWAYLFFRLGEFSEFTVAFYHSTVNFASLGYGDIVMSADWRLLGAIEAANGVLMFGLSASTMFMVMTHLFQRRMGPRLQSATGDD